MFRHRYHGRMPAGPLPTRLRRAATAPNVVTEEDRGRLQQRVSAGGMEIYIHLGDGGATVRLLRNWCLNLRCA